MREVTRHRPLQELRSAVLEASRRASRPTDSVQQRVFISYLQLTRAVFDAHAPGGGTISIDPNALFPLHDLNSYKLDALRRLKRGEFMRLLQPTRIEPIRVNGYQFRDGSLSYEISNGHHRVHVSAADYGIASVGAKVLSIYPKLPPMAYAIASGEMVEELAEHSNFGQFVGEAVWVLTESGAMFLGPRKEPIDKMLLAELLLARGADTVLV